MWQSFSHSILLDSWVSEHQCNHFHNFWKCSKLLQFPQLLKVFEITSISTTSESVRNNFNFHNFWKCSKLLQFPRLLKVFETTSISTTSESVRNNFNFHNFWKCSKLLLCLSNLYSSIRTNKASNLRIARQWFIIEIVYTKNIEKYQHSWFEILLLWIVSHLLSCLIDLQCTAAISTNIKLLIAEGWGQWQRCNVNRK